MQAQILTNNGARSCDGVNCIIGLLSPGQFSQWTTELDSAQFLQCSELESAKFATRPLLVLSKNLSVITCSNQTLKQKYRLGVGFINLHPSNDERLNMLEPMSTVQVALPRLNIQSLKQTLQKSF
jgi:hypothetical protein